MLTLLFTRIQFQVVSGVTELLAFASSFSSAQHLRAELVARHWKHNGQLLARGVPARAPLVGVDGARQRHEQLAAKRKVVVMSGEGGGKCEPPKQ